MYEHERKLALVTGAAGFLGGHIVNRLLGEGIRVRAFAWERADTRVLEGLDVEVFRGDVTRPEDCRRAVTGVDWVFHAAARVSFLPADRVVQQAVNVGGTRNMLDAAMQARVRRFIHVSTVNALGFPWSGTVGDENTAFNWGPFDIGYMETKHQAQQAVLDAAARGLDAVIGMPTTMFGPWDVNMNAASYVRGLARARGVMFCPPGGTNIVDVRAVAQGLYLAAMRGKTGQGYILGGLNVTYRELFLGILELLGRRVPVVELPAGVVLTAARACQVICPAIGKTPPLTLAMAHGSVRKLFYSSDKATRELGYRVTDPWQAVRDTIRWLG